MQLWRVNQVFSTNATLSDSGEELGFTCLVCLKFKCSFIKIEIDSGLQKSFDLNISVYHSDLDFSLRLFHQMGQQKAQETCLHSVRSTSEHLLGSQLDLSTWLWNFRDTTSLVSSHCSIVNQGLTHAAADLSKAAVRLADWCVWAQWSSLKWQHVSLTREHKCTISSTHQGV